MQKINKNKTEESASLFPQSPLKHVYTVSEVTRLIKGMLEEKIGEIWLEGEISNFKAAGSGHFYFSLKDQGALILAAMFAYANRGLKFTPQDGMKVVCFGKVDVYGPRGQYQIIVEKIEPQGVGAQQLAFEQLKKKLYHEGIFDPSHKRPLPQTPFKVGIVTSSKGAAVRDILQILKKGAPGVDVVIRSVRVQGEQAAAEIAEAVSDLNGFSGLDLIIVSRGGGSTEDLWSFNEEVVARAIYNSALPIVSAVGHQINTTLSDLAADLFVETPSAAAKIIVDRKNELLSRISELRYELDLSINNVINESRNRLTAYQHALKSPRDSLLEKQQQIDELLSGINYNIRHIMEMAKQRAGGLIRNLEALSPLAVLSRGYSLSIRMPQGTVVSDASLVKPGDKIKTVLEKGVFISLVQEVCQESKKTP
ncbi:MAG: exodeoxyribonuclease VII large subunit [Candidatus Omnitrophica bacterium]|nr:exodeoxyribonuclease VII large subunit [Candidatus Omnitrophota bacterium]